VPHPASAGFVGNVIELSASAITYGGMTIKDLTVEGTASRKQAAAGLSFTNLHDIVIENVTVGYCREGVHLAGGWGHYLRNVYAGNNVAVGFFCGQWNIRIC